MTVYVLRLVVMKRWEDGSNHRFFNGLDSRFDAEISSPFVSFISLISRSHLSSRPKPSSGCRENLAYLSVDVLRLS